MTILNTPNAQSAEAKAKADFANKKFCIHSHSLNKYLSCNSDVAAYCQEVFDTIPQYESVGKVLSAIVEEHKRLPKCVICGNYISVKLLTAKRNKGKKAYFCSSKCAMTDEGKRIQVKLFNEATGGVNPMTTEEGKRRCRQAIFDKFGVYNVSELPEIRAKANQTTFERYGVYNMWTHPDVKQKIQAEMHRKNYKSLCESLNEQKIDVLFSLEEYISKGTKGEYMPFKCQRCGLTFHRSLANVSTVYCRKCDAPGTSSKIEMELFTWLNSLIPCECGVTGLLPNASKEIDIFVRSKNIGIEFNGLYWHSEKGGKGPSYHLSKTEECAKQGIKLIHIFEDEWKFKPQIIKSRLKAIFGLTPYKIQARKCSVKPISANISKIFLEKYHLQGSCNDSVRLGLFYRNRLVAVMTFGKPRFNKNYDWELIRYATVSNFNIIGGAGKLLAYFRQNYIGTIITYADRRWSTGELYKKLGFTFVKNTKPNYFYVKSLTRLSRYQCQKHKLKNLLKENFNPELSESQNMEANKFYKIWDCGHMVFKLK